MTYRNLVNVLAGAADDAVSLSLAATLARQNQGEVRVILALPLVEARDWALIAPYGVGPAVLQGIADAKAAARRGAEALARELSAWNGFDIAPGRGRIRLVGEASITHVDLQGELPLCDLLVVGHGALQAAGLWNAMITEALLKARTPMLVVRCLPDETPTPAVIAWDGSPQAGRAVRAALPFLRAASEVLVLQDPETLRSANAAASDPERLADYLELQQLPRPTIIQEAGVSRANGLLRRATAHDAGLLVAGAFGHSRLREEILGGTTEALLGSPRLVNLLISH